MKPMARRAPGPRPSSRSVLLIALVAVLGGLIAYFNPSAPAQPPPTPPPSQPEEHPILPLPQAPAEPEDHPILPLPQAPAEPWAELRVANAFDERIVRRVRPAGEAKPVALTFDDGPWPQTTPAVLEVLAQEGVRATFFWVGRQLERYPDLARQVVAEGHAVGNHTYNHRTAPSPLEVAAQEIDRTGALIEGVTGVRSSLFRPPGGHLENGLVKYALERGYVVVMWSALSGDTDPKYTVADIVNNVLGRVRPGSIILLHDGGGDRSRTLAALPELIKRLRAEGYHFVTVPELLESGQVDPHPWSTSGP